MGTVDINVGFAFLAGLASFLAPCVLPLVPAYLGYLSGYAVTRSEARTLRARLYIVGHAALFVLGFTLVFVLLGSAAGSLGALLSGSVLRYVVSLIVIFFGLALLGWLNLPFLERTVRLEWRAQQELGLLSSVLVGMVFAAGWTPCVGPALASILALSARQQTMARGAFLLASYSLGLGLPFILAALLVDRLSAFLLRIGRYLPLIQKVIGVLMVAIGILMLTQGFDVIGAWFEERGIGWDLGL
jgi:cytochrome c-type biogenesis protein